MLWKITPLYFFLVKRYILLLKGAHYSENFSDFWVVKSKFVKFLMPILKLQINSFSNFASFFIVMTHSSPINFKLIYYLPWIKVPHKSLNLGTFKCSGENLLNSSCHFLNHKSAFLQILHPSLVSWNINHLYVFSSNIIYFAQKQPIKV